MTISLELGRVLVIAFAALSGTALVLAVASGWRAARIRPGIDVVRIVLGVSGLVTLGALVGAQTPVILAAAAAATGFVLGLAQGATMRVELRDGRPFGRRSPAGLTAWGAGLVAMQLAGLGSRVEVFRLGQAAGIFGVALMAGVLVGRAAPVRRARLGRGGAAAAAALVTLTIVAVSAPGARAQTPLDDPETACAVMPDGLRIVQLELNEAGDEKLVGACRAFDDERVVQLSFFHDAARARALFDSEDSYGAGVSVLGNADVGERGERIGLSGSGFNAIAFVRGPFIVTATSESGGVPSEAASLELARQTDAKIVALLELAAAAASDPGSTTGETPGGGAGAGNDPAAGSSSSGGSGDDQTGTSGAGDTTDGAGATEQGVSVPAAEEDDGFLGGGSITVEEAVTAAAAAILVSFAMGAITLAEAGTQLSSLFRRSEVTDRSAELLEVMRRAGGPANDGSFEPLPVLGSGELEPLDHGPGATFPSAESERLTLPPSEVAPAVEPTGARPTDDPLGDLLVDPLADAPPIGGKVLTEVDADFDGVTDAVEFDTDGDGELDTMWTPTGGQSDVDPALTDARSAEPFPEAAEPVVEEIAPSEAPAGTSDTEPAEPELASPDDAATVLSDHTVAANSERRAEPTASGSESSMPEPESDRAAEAASGTILVTSEEVADILERGRRNGATEDELQRYLDGLNEARGGSGSVLADLRDPTVAPGGNRESVGLPSGETVTAGAAETAAYREAVDTLEGTALLDGFLQDAYRDAVVEKQKWVAWELMPEVRWAAALDQLRTEVAEFDAQVADADVRLRAITTTKSFADRGPKNPLYDFHMKRYWEQAQGDIPKLHEEISKLKQARLERIQQLMGSNVYRPGARDAADPGTRSWAAPFYRGLRRFGDAMGTTADGETRLPTGTNAAETSMAHRPSVMLDEIEAHMDHIIAERMRVMELRSQARSVVEAFESRGTE